MMEGKQSSPHSHETTTDTSHGSLEQQTKPTDPKKDSIPLSVSTTAPLSPHDSYFNDVHSTISDLHSIHSRSDAKRKDKSSKLATKINKLSSEVIVLREKLEQMKYKNIEELEDKLQRALSENLILRQRNDEYRQRVNSLDDELSRLRFAATSVRPTLSSSSSSIGLKFEHASPDLSWRGLATPKSLESRKHSATSSSRRISEVEAMQNELNKYKRKADILEVSIVSRLSYRLGLAWLTATVG
jgi:hypothetical protein